MLRLRKLFTLRGWGLLAGGACAIALAAIMGRKDLLTLGIFLLLLPLTAATLLRLSRAQLRVDRSFRPELGFARRSVQVQLRVSSNRHMRKRLSLKETLPATLGTGPRFYFPGRSSEFPDGKTVSYYEYSVHPSERGRYDVGPLFIELIDPLGLSISAHRIRGVKRLTVAPPLQHLEPTNPTGSVQSQGSMVSPSLLHATEVSATTRQYQRGDPVRRVHWPATARHQELMVRQEEAVTHPEIVIVVDVATEHFAEPSRSGTLSVDSGATGLRSTPSFEWVVRAAMSLCAQFIEAGYQVRLLDFAGRRLPGLPEHVGKHGHPDAISGIESVAHCLATVELDDDAPTSLAQSLGTSIAAGAPRGPVVVLAGTVSTDFENSALHMQSHQRQNTIFLCSAPNTSLNTSLRTSAESPNSQAPLARLSAAGWTVRHVHPETHIGHLLSDLNADAGTL